MKVAFSSYFWKLVLVFVCACVFVNRYMSRPTQLSLTMDMAATGPSKAQLFYNLGAGYRETDSVTMPITSTSLDSFQGLSFAIPGDRVSTLRFDPLINEGQVAIRNVLLWNRGSVIQSVDLKQIQPINQIASNAVRGAIAEFATTPKANDPSVYINFAQVIDVAKLQRRFQVITNSLLALLFAGWVVMERPVTSGWQRALQGGRTVHLRFARIAQKPTGGFILLNVWSIWIYFGLLLCFVIAAALNLNGSSEAVYSEQYGEGAAARMVLGHAQTALKDEWEVETPAILHQAFRANRFSIEGAGANVPAKKLIEVFRPQFWSFFALRVDYAYAIYWQAKALMLIGGVFTLLLWLTGSNGAALTGALWYFFSGFTQWNYSMPQGLPEMVGTTCVTVVCTCYLISGGRKKILVAAAVIAAICGADFVLAADLSHIVPLLCVAVALVTAWCVASGRRLFQADGLVLRLALIAVVVIVWIFAAFAIPPAKEMASDLPWWKFGWDFLSWKQTGEQFPAVFGSIGNASGFLWLAPATIFGLRGISVTAFQKVTLIALWICAALLLVLRLGEGIMPTLGLVNVSIVAIHLARFRPLQRADYGDIIRHGLLSYLAPFLVLYIAMAFADGKLANFFPGSEVTASAALAALLCMWILMGKPRAFAVCLLLPLAVSFGRVNPLERGLRVFTKSLFKDYVHQHHEMLTAKWVVFGSKPSEAFITAVGCDVSHDSRLTGIRYAAFDAKPLRQNGVFIAQLDGFWIYRIESK